MSNDKEWFDGRSMDEQLERCYWRRVGAAVFLGLVLALFVGLVHGQPFAVAKADNGSVTLHRAPCELKSQIANLPYKAVWLQDGKTFEGCWAHHPYGLVVAYFDDLTVVLIQPQVFQPLRAM